MERIIVKNPKQTISTIACDINKSLSTPISSKTIRRELHSAGYYGRVAARKPFLSSTNKLKRKTWAELHKKWTPDQWRKVVFSDESTFSLYPTSGAVTVWRKGGQTYNQNCISSRVRCGGGKVNVWGSISFEGVGSLIVLDGIVNANKYLNILSDHVHPMMQTLFEDGSGIFQDDNAPIHRATIVKKWFEDHESDTHHLDWPPQSPDANIIEHVWSYLEKQLRKRETAPINKEELQKAIYEEWLRIPRSFITELYDSLPRRMEAICNNKGGNTKY